MTKKNQNYNINGLPLNPSILESMGEGLKKILENKNVSGERMPILEVVFDRFSVQLTNNFRGIAPELVNVGVHSIKTQRFEDYLANVPEKSLLSIFHAEEWKNYGLITFDKNFSFCMIDVLLGGRQAGAKDYKLERAYTSIERNLIERLTTVVLKTLSQSFQPITQIEFKFSHLEANPKFASIAQPSSATLVIKIFADMDGGQSHIDIVLPYATIEPVRDIFSQRFMGEKLGQDLIWQEHLAKETYSSKIRVHAVLDIIQHNLGDVLNWQVGSQFLLNNEEGSPIRVFCGSTPLLEAKVGSKGLSVAVCVTDILLNKKEAKL